MAELPPQFVEILLCPKCRKERVKQVEGGFACAACKLLYPVEDGLPNFLLESAKPL